MVPENRKIVSKVLKRCSVSMDDEQFYLTGGCQYFALALWNVSDIREIGVLYDRSDQTVAHVVGVNFPTGYDVLGERFLSEITSRYDDLVDPDWDMVSASQLKSEYMGSGKPLWSYDQQEIEDAEELILREGDDLFPSLEITRNT